MAYESSARAITKRFVLPDAEFNSASVGDIHFAVAPRERWWQGVRETYSFIVVTLTGFLLMARFSWLHWTSLRLSVCASACASALAVVCACAR